MANKIAALSGEELSTLLLDYVKMRVSSAQKTAIEEAMITHPEIAEEVAYYQGLHNALQHDDSADTENELGWARLERAINDEAKNPEPANDNTRFWKVAVAALGLVIAGQTALLVGGFSSNEEPIYVTAAAPSDDGFLTHVDFSENASAQEITDLLRSVSAEVSAGPSALGLYTVRFDSEADRSAGMRQLTETPDIVKSVSVK